MPRGQHAAGKTFTIEDLDQLITNHRRILDALILTRDLIRGDAPLVLLDVPRPPRAVAASTVLAHAVALDQARRAQNGNSRHGARPAKSPLRQQRAHSAAILARFDPAQPRSWKRGWGRGLGALVRRGYLVAKDNGYVRTGKPYVV